MPEILLIAENSTQTDTYAVALSELDPEIEVIRDLATARDRLNRPAPDIVIIDVPSADGGPGMLVGQMRASWAGTYLIAMTPTKDLAASKLNEMGLWTPDLTLVHPVSSTRLCAAVSRVLAGDTDPAAVKRAPPDTLCS